MSKHLRRLIPGILVFALIAALGAGCATQTPARTEAPAPGVPPATAEGTAPAPAPEVDRDQILTEAVVQYFRTLPPTVHQIKAPDLKAALDAGSSPYFILDIRRAEDFAKGHIEGAANIPFATVGDNLDKLPKDKQIVVVCYSGQTAGQTVAALRLAGYNAVALHYGMTGWVEKSSFPTVQ